MNLSQSILATGALVVLSFLIITTNRMIVLSKQDQYRSYALNAASEFASSIINEAMTKKFDDKYSDKSYQSTSNFTSASALGAESPKTVFSISVPDTLSSKGKYYSTKAYTDFDDYNGYVRKSNIATMKGFIAICTVYYVSNTSTDSINNATKTVKIVGGNLNVASSTQSYFKRIVVSVEQPQYLPRIPDPVTGRPQISFSSVKAYQ